MCLRAPRRVTWEHSIPFAVGLLYFGVFVTFLFHLLVPCCRQNADRVVAVSGPGVGLFKGDADFMVDALIEACQKRPVPVDKDLSAPTRDLVPFFPTEEESLETRTKVRRCYALHACFRGMKQWALDECTLLRARVGVPVNGNGSGAEGSVLPLCLMKHCVYEAIIFKNNVVAHVAAQQERHAIGSVEPGLCKGGPGDLRWVELQSIAITTCYYCSSVVSYMQFFP